MRSALAILLLLPLLLIGSPQPSRTTIEWPVEAAAPDEGSSDLAATAGQFWGAEPGLPPLPDGRFLMAVGDIARFFSPLGGNCQAEADFDPPDWTIRCGPQAVGRLSARPDFSELRQLLSRWAEKRSHGMATGQADPLPAQATRSIDGDLGRFEPASLISALKRLDQLWKQGSRHPLLLERAARGLVLLTIQSGGLEELNDRLAGRALALLALAGEGYGLQNVEAEEALLAQHMGYRYHALEASSQLPADHPVRLYLQGSLNDLRQAAEQASRKEAPLVRYLHLKRLAQAGLIQDWDYWARRHFPGLQMPLPVLNSRPANEGGSVSQWQRTLDLSRLEAARLLDELSPGIEKLFPPHPALAQDWAIERIRPMLWQDGQVSLEEFDALLNSLESLYPGPFLDGAALSGFVASPFFSALYRLADLSLRQNACLPAFPLDDPFPFLALKKERAVALQAWYRQQSRANDWPPPQLFLAAPDASSQLEAFDKLLTLLPYDERQLAVAAREVSGRLDSRPSHRKAQCRWRSSLGVKALAEGFRSQAAEWFESLEKADCGLAPPLELAQWIRHGRTAGSFTQSRKVAKYAKLRN